MSDIVKRLNRAELYTSGGEVSDLPEEAADTITRLTAEVKKLRAALLVARNYVLVQSCELSLMPEDAARDLDVIDEALEEDDDDQG